MPDVIENPVLNSPVLEVTRERKKDKESKVNTASGRWAFLEIHDPWDAKNLIRAFLASLRPVVPAQ